MVEAEQNDENRRCGLMNMLAAMATQFLLLLLLLLLPAAAPAAALLLYLSISKGSAVKFHLPPAKGA